jgi:hypothetical protein
MGMFDYVNVNISCPKCGRENTNFQSKDSLCHLDRIDPQYVNEFHALCDCGYWISFERKQRISRENHREEPYNLEEVLGLGFQIIERTS